MLPETLSYKAFNKLTEPCLSDPILHRSLKMSVPVGTCAVAATPLYISNIHLKLRETDMWLCEKKKKKLSDESFIIF